MVVKQIPIVMIVVLISIYMACRPIQAESRDVRHTLTEPGTTTVVIPTTTPLKQATATILPPRMTLVGPVVSPSPTLSSSAVYPIVMYPPYESRSGYLLGATYEGTWIDSAKAAPLLKGSERYDMYTDKGFLGTGVGDVPKPNSPICPAMQEVILTPPPPVHSVMAIGGPWNALPRLPQEIPIDHVVYRQVLEELLESNGVNWRELRLTRLLRVDLDGDGDDEVVISATDFAEGTGHDVAVGDYSLVVIRTIGPEGVITLPLVADYYGQARQNAFPIRYNLTGVFDLNGDGSMEVVVSITGWDRLGAIVFEVRETTVEDILEVRCWY